MVIRLYFLLLLFFCFPAIGQVKVYNLSYFEKFFKADTSARLLIIGESHASAAGSETYFPILKYLNETTGLHHLLVEFGPSEAYFYNRYLKSGNEKYLGYTIYAGFYKGWREAWRKVYQYQKKQQVNIKVSGIDFDRTRTLGYALYNIFKQYDNLPEFINELMDEIRSQAFFKTYTIGYPAGKDIQWADSAKTLLKLHWPELRKKLNKMDQEVITEIISNKAVNYAKGREMGIVENIKRVIKNADENRFMLMIGRDHAYDHHPVLKNKEWIAHLLKETPGIKILSGVMLFENSELAVDEKKNVRLFEIKDKLPWKKYYSSLAASAKGDITIIPLVKDLQSLAYYTDFVILAKNQPRYEVYRAK